MVGVGGSSVLGAANKVAAGVDGGSTVVGIAGGATLLWNIKLTSVAALVVVAAGVDCMGAAGIDGVAGGWLVGGTPKNAPALVPIGWTTGGATAGKFGIVVGARDKLGIPNEGTGICGTTCGELTGLVAEITTRGLDRANGLDGTA